MKENFRFRSGWEGLGWRLALYYIAMHVLLYTTYSEWQDKRTTTASSFLPRPSKCVLSWKNRKGRGKGGYGKWALLAGVAEECGEP